jgi:LemA protein
MAVVERYPELKADGQMSRVMEELSSTENRISFARQAYNDAVTEYNTKREVFPTSIVAGIFNFAPATLLESTDSAAQREAPQVKF